MKFCKNLQHVANISDPEWAPFWTNYKMLKKLIKELPTLIQSSENQQVHASDTGTSNSTDNKIIRSEQTTQSHITNDNNNNNISSSNSDDDEKNKYKDPAKNKKQVHSSEKKAMGKSPGEVAFFKLLHSELQKATRFFDKALIEYSIREERIQEGKILMQKPNAIMVEDRWSLLGKSVFRLYKDLLLLEIYAIMTYCAFSKILKKHDKVTGYNTRKPFMVNVVNKANFTSYPELLSMINRTETLYEDVSSQYLLEEKDSLCEDERLFLNMIQNLNKQALSALESEDSPESNEQKARLKQSTTVLKQNQSSGDDSSSNTTLSSKSQQTTTVAAVEASNKNQKSYGNENKQNHPIKDSSSSIIEEKGGKRVAITTSSSETFNKRAKRKA